MDEEKIQTTNVNERELYSIFAQIIASFSSALLMFNVAAAFALVSVVNGKLTNNSDVLTISKEQSSWYGSLQILSLIIGSVFAGYLIEYFGRKRCMLLCSIPQLLSYIILYFSTQPFHLYISSLLSGFGIAIAEVPASTFIGEITTSKLRGRLFVFSKLGYAFGSLFLYFLNSYFDWRELALIMMACPIICASYILMIPETPFWLLTKGRDEDALESLCWFRGWATPTNLISEEFATLQQYIKQSSDGKLVMLGHPAKKLWWHEVKCLLNSQFLKPYKLVSLLFFLCYVISLRTVKPYIIIILNRYNLSISSSMILAMSSVSQILGALLMVLTVNKFGKRKLILWTYCCSASCTAIFGLYALLYQRFQIYLPCAIYSVIMIIYFLVGYTVGGMPWYICAEIFPQKFRGIGGGVSIMTANLMMFTLMKSYFTLEALFDTSNIFFLYSAFGIIGIIYIYIKLPETENKTLEEIEQILSQKKKNPSLT